MEKGEILKLITQRHKEWHYLTMAFGCNRETAEDIVQDMYVKIISILDKGTQITYKNDVNTYYILKTLKSIFIDKTRKEKTFHQISIDHFDDWTSLFFDNQYESQDNVNFDSVNKKIQKELKKLYWFDSKVFDIVNSGEKISDLSRKTTIPYYTLYNTYKKVYNHLKSLI